MARRVNRRKVLYMASPPLGSSQLSNCGIHGAEAMRVATEQLDRLPCPVYHVLGNHELYHLSRSRVSELLHFPSQDCAHYAFQPRPHIRCLVLDTFDVSLEGRDPGDPRHDLALQYLECNPNQDRNDCEGSVCV